MSTISIIASHVPNVATEHAESEVPTSGADTPAGQPVGANAPMYGFHGDAQASGSSSPAASSSANSAAPTYERARADSPYSDLPADLKRVLGKVDWPDKWWNGLSAPSREHLVAIYNRMQSHGLWNQVDRIVKVVDPERPALGMRVPGRSGSIVFAGKDGSKLLEGSLATGRFGVDPKLLAFFHKGQISLREWSSTEDGLHLSISGGGAFDAHMDKISPTLKPDENGETQVEMGKSGQHWHDEVIPDILRNGLEIFGIKIPGTHIPGVTVDIGAYNANKPLPHPDPGHQEPQNSLPPIDWGIKITLHSGGGDKSRTLGQQAAAPGTRDVDAAAMERVTKAVASFHEDALVAPSAHLGHDDFPSPRDLAADIAMRLAYAAQHGQPTIELGFKEPYGHANAADRKAVSEEVRRIAAAVTAEMAKDNPAIANIGTRINFNK